MMNIIIKFHLKPLSIHKKHTVFDRKLWFFLVSICLFCDLSAQNLPRIGNVLDENGKGISGVYLVAVDTETSEVLATAISDADGKYALPAVTPPFILNATRIGYTRVNIPVNNETDIETVRTIRMQITVEQLQEVVVTEAAHITSCDLCL